MPPSKVWNNPNKLEELPLAPLLSSIAIENPNVAIPATGATQIREPPESIQKVQWLSNVSDTIITPITCIVDMILSNSNLSI